MVLFLKVYRRRVQQIAVVNGVELLIVLHQQTLRIYSAMLDHILGTCVMLIEVSQVIADLDGVLRPCPLNGSHACNCTVTVTWGSDLLSFLSTQIVVNYQIL